MTKLKLITETSKNIDVDKTKSGLYVVGVYSSADLINENGRVYKKSLLEREISKIDNKIKNKSLWGELGHPSGPSINLDKISILIENLVWDRNDILGRAKVLDTPMGNIAKTLIENGKLGISSRSLGTVSEDGYVNEDLNLITWDLVSDPSNNPSWVNGVYEDKYFEFKDINNLTLEDAKNEYTKHIWQVLENISKNL